MTPHSQKFQKSSLTIECGVASYSGHQKYILRVSIYQTHPPQTKFGTWSIRWFEVEISFSETLPFTRIKDLVCTNIHQELKKKRWMRKSSMGITVKWIAKSLVLYLNSGYRIHFLETMTCTSCFYEYMYINIQNCIYLYI